VAAAKSLEVPGALYFLKVYRRRMEEGQRRGALKLVVAVGALERFKSHSGQKMGASRIGSLLSPYPFLSLGL
jgi:hypothetical protein